MLVLVTEMEVKVYLGQSPGLNWSWPLEKMTQVDYDECIQSIKEIVANEDSVDRPTFKPQPQIIAPHEATRHVVITDSLLKPYLEPLADWHTRKGMNCSVQSLESILTHTSGTTDHEKVRNFIRHQYSQYGLRYVLLASNSIPDVIFGCEYLPRENTVSDLYYANLDSTWDLNGNGLYGCHADSVGLSSPDGYQIEERGGIDYGADVHIGRMPLSDSSQAKTFVDKVLEYEKTPVEFWDRDCLLLGACLAEYPDPMNVSGGLMQDTMSVELPTGMSYTRLYDDIYTDCGGLQQWWEPINRDDAMAELRLGYRVVGHAGHGLRTRVDVRPEISETHEIFRGDLDTLSNEGKGCFYSMGCLTADWRYPDTTCFGKHWVANDSGGGTSYLGNGGESYSDIV
jgi:hypothetical protein